jgi:dTDP-glucose 4,6-dehydratase
MHNIKNALVTGAGGFIGSHLTERLVRDGVQVRALVHYNSRNDWGHLDHLPADVKSAIEVVTGDIQDPFAVRSAVRGCDTVFHLSSLIAIPFSYVAPQSYVATNINGALNVVQAARDEGVQKVVHTSTSECYGTALYVPIDEKHPLQGQSPYSASKIGADMIAESYQRSFDVPVAIIRPFNTFGPRQSARAFIPNVIVQALAGKPIRVGNLHPTRDMNFVLDTVEGFLAVARSPKSVGQVINIGSGREIGMLDLANLIISLTGKKVDIVSESQRIRPENSEVERLLCDNSKARELLGWTPKHTLEEGLKATIAYIEANLGRYKADIYNI